ncbi:MAG: tetratricopeptide repeat protein [Sphingomicrobium sp.]
MVRSRLAVTFCAVLIGSPAIAQEEGTVPGAIPDPSTYQGSMVLQQQSDAQDQQFRSEQQQQQSQTQSYQQQSASGSGQSYQDPSYSTQRTAARASPPANPLAAAFQRGDYTTVLRILRPKAAAGNPSAEHNLGFMYEKGYGVPRNPSLAASWYRKSADQGYPAGQLALGRLYFEGVGIQRDLVEAYKWMYLAGRGTAKAFQYINVIGNMLTYDQMSEAMRRGQMWEPVVHH